MQRNLHLTYGGSYGTLSGGAWREHPLQKIIINLNVVRWAIESESGIVLLRKMILHEIGHYVGLDHTDGTYGEHVPGTPSNDPESVMRSRNALYRAYSYYDLLALKFAFNNSVGLNRGLDFIPVPPGDPINGNSWKFWDKTSFPDENYSFDEISTGGSYPNINKGWTYDNNTFYGAFDKDCVTSGDISDNEMTWLRLRFNTARDGSVSTISDNVSIDHATLSR